MTSSESIVSMISEQKIPSPAFPEVKATTVDTHNSDDSYVILSVEGELYDVYGSKQEANLEFRDLDPKEYILVKDSALAGKRYPTPGSMGIHVIEFK